MIPEANINTVEYDHDGIGHVVLEPGDATHYAFDFVLATANLTVIQMSSPHRGQTAVVKNIQHAEPNYDDPIIKGVAEKFGNLHSAAIVVLAIKHLLGRPHDIVGAAEYAMKIRSISQGGKK